MNENCGYVTPDGVCVEPVLPIATWTVDTAPLPDELADTGASADPIVTLAMVAGLMLSLGLGLLRWAHDRITVRDDDHR